MSTSIYQRLIPLIRGVPIYDRLRSSSNVCVRCGQNCGHFVYTTDTQQARRSPGLIRRGMLCVVYALHYAIRGG